VSVSGEQSCPDNHSSFRCAAANKACNAQTSASSCVTSGTGICDIVIRMSANAFCSCSLNVFSSIPVRETVRESLEPVELPAVRFPPPPPLTLPAGNHFPCPCQRQRQRGCCRRQSSETQGREQAARASRRVLFTVFLRVSALHRGPAPVLFWQPS